MFRARRSSSTSSMSTTRPFEHTLTVAAGGDKFRRGAASGLLENGGVLRLSALQHLLDCRPERTRTIGCATHGVHLRALLRNHLRRKRGGESRRVLCCRRGDCDRWTTTALNDEGHLDISASAGAQPVYVPSLNAHATDFAGSRWAQPVPNAARRSRSAAVPTWTWSAARWPRLAETSASLRRPRPPTEVRSAQAWRWLQLEPASAKPVIRASRWPSSGHVQHPN
jgi:hypothetical protein